MEELQGIKIVQEKYFDVEEEGMIPCYGAEVKTSDHVYGLWVDNRVELDGGLSLITSEPIDVNFNGIEIKDWMILEDSLNYCVWNAMKNIRGIDWKWMDYQEEYGDGVQFITFLTSSDLIHVGIHVHSKFYFKIVVTVDGEIVHTDII